MKRAGLSEPGPSLPLVLRRLGAGLWIDDVGMRGAIEVVREDDLAIDFTTGRAIHELAAGVVAVFLDLHRDVPMLAAPGIEEPNRRCAIRCYGYAGSRGEAHDAGRAHFDDQGQTSFEAAWAAHRTFLRGGFSPK